MRFGKAILVAMFGLLAVSANGEELQWVRGIGGPQNDYANCSAVDTFGNLYVGGGFSGTVDFDPGPGVAERTSHGYLDAFVAQYDALGRFQWVWTAGGAFDDTCTALTYVGNTLYVAGNFEGTVDFNPGASVANLSAPIGGLFLLRLYYNGSTGPVGLIATCNSAVVKKIAHLSDGMYVAGEFDDTFTSPNGFIRNTHGESDIFLAKVDWFSYCIWVQSFGSENYDRLNDMVVDSDESPVIAGSFLGNMTLRGYPPVTLYNTTSNREGYVIKFQSDGTPVWTKTLGSTSDVRANALARSLDGDVLLLGGCNGQVDFDPNPISSYHNDDAYLLKMDPQGNTEWVEWLSRVDAGTLAGRGLFSAGDGTIYALGDYSGGLRCSDPTMPAIHATGADSFLMAWNANGTPKGMRSLGAATYSAPNCMVVREGVYIVGRYFGTQVFNIGNSTTQVTSFGASDAYLSRVTPIFTRPRIVSIERIRGDAQVGEVVFRVTFDKDVSGVDAGLAVLHHAGTTHSGVTVTGSGNRYEFTVEGVSGPGEFSLELPPSASVLDENGNSLVNGLESSLVQVNEDGPIPLPLPWAALAVLLATVAIWRMRWAKTGKRADQVKL